MTPARRVWDADRLQAPHSQPDKSLRVRRMFDAIAPTYELVNTVFSGGRDRAWRRKSVSLAMPTAGDALLDVACGTGDFARTFAASTPAPGRIVGCDFSSEMLRRAADQPSPAIEWSLADATALPFADESFDIVSCAFGVRNFQDLDAGLSEMRRVLRPGGRAVILEFSRPTNPVWRRVYEFYTSTVLPFGATLVSRDRTGAYRYLPSSVVSFSGVKELCGRLEQVGFDRVQPTSATLGVVTVYLAFRDK
jgi:demethylmenaquinone methyltransferase / 2-methoxy-6-polyprenyl-1,4-benzoquinol methylase